MANLTINMICDRKAMRAAVESWSQYDFEKYLRSCKVLFQGKYVRVFSDEEIIRDYKYKFNYMIADCYQGKVLT